MWTPASPSRHVTQRHLASATGAASRPVRGFPAVGRAAARSRPPTRQMRPAAMTEIRLRQD